MGRNGGAPHKLDRGGVYFRRRRECAGRNFAYQRDFADELGGHGQIPIVAGVRTGEDALGDFPLHQEDCAWEAGVKSKELIDDWGGDVVRQIARYQGRTPLGKIRREYIRMVDVEPRLAPKFTLKYRDERRIELNGVKLICKRQKMTSECTSSRADFNDTK